MKIQKSTVAALLLTFLIALILTGGVFFNYFGVEKTRAQTLETNNQPEPQTIDNSAEFQKARRVVRLKDEFKSAIKNKKADWVLSADKKAPYGVNYLTWELQSKKVIGVIHDYESTEEAKKAFSFNKSPLSTSTGLPKTAQNGFGDESFLTFADLAGKNMNLTFRSDNYLISLTGTKEDIFSFAKLISTTISENK